MSQNAPHLQRTETAMLQTEFVYSGTEEQGREQLAQLMSNLETYCAIRDIEAELVDVLEDGKYVFRMFAWATYEKLPLVATLLGTFAVQKP